MIGNTFCFDWEIQLIQTLQAFGGAAGEKLATFFTLFGEDAMMLAVIGIFYWGFSKRKGRIIGLNFVPALLGGCMLKNVVQRRRPYMDHEAIRCVRVPTKGADLYDVSAQGFSFPSLHAMDSMTIFGSIACLFSKAWVKALCSLLILAVGMSRVFIGVHYPTDVLTGWALGIASIALMDFVRKRVSSSTKMAAGAALLALPGWFFCVSTDFYSGYGLLLGMGATFWFEEHVASFENTRSVPRAILRTVGGVAVFAVLSSLLKKPFPADMQEGVTLASHLIRTMRYGVSIFAALGIYPLVFRYTAKIGAKKSA